MNTPTPKPIWRWLGRGWALVDSTRRAVFNLIFLFLFIIILISIFSGGGGTKLQEKTALVLNLDGPIVEARSEKLNDLLAAKLGDKEAKPIVLSDVLAVLDAAGKDPKIERVYLNLEGLKANGLTSLREIAAALERFKATGKQIIAWGENYSQGQYYLAAQASEIYLHPEGAVLLTGFGGYRNYYKDALDKLGISFNLIKVGTYKDAAEPFIANAPSPAALESTKYLYDGLWASYTESIEKARKLPAGSLAKGIDTLPQQLAETAFDTGKLALKNKLVDGLKTRSEIRELMIERGAKDNDNKTFRQITFNNYLRTIKPQNFGNAIGVVIAEGEIDETGKIGGRATADMIRRARENDDVKAIVLRVNSPGGSAFGSELIRQELEQSRKAGKPVIVSMGNLAASGGYWISLAADEVIADAGTITGSIGVFGLLPTAEKTMEKLSINTGGYTTTWLQGAYDPRRAIDPRFIQIVQGSVEKIYRDFLTKTATARKTTPEKIDEHAQGRVWTGLQAKERGLVDRIGSYPDALKAAAAKAKLAEDSRILYIQPETTPFERFMSQLENTSSGLINRHLMAQYLPAALTGSVAIEAQKDLNWLKQTADNLHQGTPYTAITHCLCGEQ